MSRKITAFIASSALAAILAAGGGAQTASAQVGSTTTKTVWEGVYTADQALRGQSGFQKVCSGCHRDDLQGRGSEPSLAGQSFVDHWREDDLVPLFTYIRISMPRQAATTVSDTDKVDILAYLLQSNHFPAGNEELKVSLLGNVRLVGKDGPQPLPSTTSVRALGCLTMGPGNVWTLSNATEPVRDSKPDETTPEELKLAETSPLGSLTFKLPSLNDFAIPDVKPSSFKGHKVQVKGVVYRQSGNDRINAHMLASVGSTCNP